MSWSEFCKNFGLDPRMHPADLSKIITMPKEGIESALKWVKNPKASLFLHGEPGRGKTYFMHALMKKLIETYSCVEIRWHRMKELDDKILDAIKEKSSSSYLLKCLCEVDFLFLDDFGIERPTERCERDIYEIIDKRNGWFLPTVISSNLDREGIERFYGQRILSRLKEFSWIRFNGTDLRGTGV